MQFNAAFTELITVARSTPGVWTNGTFIAGATLPLSFRASVQPLKGMDQMNLPEGQRTQENIRLYATQPLQIADESKALKADIITRAGGVRYEVHQSAPWVGLGRTYYQATAVRLEAPRGG
jgi:hypothetical protein